MEKKYIEQESIDQTSLKILESCQNNEIAAFLHMVIDSHVQLIRLIKAFGNPRSAIAAGVCGWQGILNGKNVAKLVHELNSSCIEEKLKILKEQDIRYVYYGQEEYPKRLNTIKNPPFGLFYKGILPSDRTPSLAIIGSRSCSAYGRQMAREFARAAALAKIQIISGMATGIDGISENAAIAAGGLSFGILGTGVNICYPECNRELYELSCQKGGIISELPPFTPPAAYNFPKRNRIIAGLSDSILVIEARPKSGTSITVEQGLDMGKDIYVLPGRITDSLSQGCNMLLRDGALPALNPQEFIKDFFRNLKIQGRSFDMPCSNSHAEKNDSKNYHGFLTAKEKKLMAFLDFEPKTISEIFIAIEDSNANMTLQEAMTTLTSMTAQGKIRCAQGCYYYLENQ